MMFKRLRKILSGGIGVGILLTLGVTFVSLSGALDSLERWFYDRRAMHCQFFTPPPTDRLVHLDIDDAALEAIGAWPWHRSVLAEMVDEINLAQPKAMAFDLMLHEPQEARFEPRPDGTFVSIHDDEMLAASLKRLNAALVPLSLPPEPPRMITPAEQVLSEALASNLELSDTDAMNVLRAHGHAPPTMDRAFMDMLIRARRRVMQQRVMALLRQRPTTLEQLRQALLPRTDAIVKSPAVRLLEEQYSELSAQLPLERFTLAQPAGVTPALQADILIGPARRLAEAARATAFVDYVKEGDGTVRRVPLFMAHEGRLYPAFGLALAAMMMDADLSTARLTENSLTLDRKGALPLVIPLYTMHSASLERDVPFMFDIPWFGRADDWENMYNRVGAGHLSCNVVWDACQTREKIILNNRNVDNAVACVLGDTPKEPGLGLDRDRATKYAARLPDVQDVESRKQIAQFTLNALDASGWLQAFSNIKELKPDEKQQYDLLVSSRHDLTILLDQAGPLAAQLATQRALLRQRLGGRAILMGWTATAQSADQVPTSIHAKCPGVVIHGTIFSAMMTERFWRRAPIWANVCITLFMGLGTVWLVSRLTPLRALISAAGLAVLYTLFNGIVLFDWGRWLANLGGPLVAVAVAWAGCTLVRLLIESVERARISTETKMLRHEMDLARKAQQALIPKQHPEVHGIDAVGWTMPASTTGGDCFDLWKTPDGRLGILLADASGHGLGPAMIVTQVRTLVRALSETDVHPHHLLGRVNFRLCEDLESGQFVTTFLAFLSTDGELEWSSAGHGPVFIRTGRGEKLIELEPPSLPLGIIPEWLEPAPATQQLASGGMLLLVSDGIFEAVAPGKAMFGVPRMVEIADADPDAHPTERVAALRDAVSRWYDSHEPLDDQTIVIVRRRHEEAAVVVESVPVVVT